MSESSATGVWRDVIGQPTAVQVLQDAVRDPARMTHGWLLTGPPGSGRSTAARAFAAALECPDDGCGQCRECRTVAEGTHADVTVMSTQGLSIQVRDARELARLAQHRPTVGHWRVIIIEDADRLTERAADALLKALEEPVPRTVWVLCAPSVEDVIITIRSRSRHIGLRTPAVAAVAELLTRRDGIDPQVALHAARAAQSHVGLARRLARDQGARTRRETTLLMAGRIRGLGDAMTAAADLAALATEESSAASGERNATEKMHLLEQLGADPAARTQPPHVRSQLSALEKEQKTRATRFGRDVIDRSLVDLLSIYRDALVVQLGEPVELVNTDLREEVLSLSTALRAEGLLNAMDAIGTARERITANVPPLLALEAMTISLQLPA
ncbi:DNA polymerase III subunit delta' [Leekyejoonella antrihumi]|uniref:DNA polymerase III subunit delta' n=1 Tax=Leekyejoonella antrihumi TaxID=1660198 RepID=A0A563DX83_9MICO|nr:DNA polymerase III subunit delta' [Leekyejoonella antrihumi]TWP34294.1 DNA polymerase III subunit delta' [Leekyejoonella antrihumi]